MPPDVGVLRRHLAGRLGDVRVDRGMSMASLAEALGRSPEELERWESGRVPLTIPMLIEWSRALRLNIVLQPADHDAAGPSPIRVTLRRGRRMALPREQSISLTQDQIARLRESAVPHTGNRLVTALKLTDATIADLARTTALRYTRVAGWVQGRVKTVPRPYALHVATCLGCNPQDLFPNFSTDEPTR